MVGRRYVILGRRARERRIARLQAIVRTRLGVRYPADVRAMLGCGHAYAPLPSDLDGPLVDTRRWCWTCGGMRYVIAVHVPGDGGE